MIATRTSDQARYSRRKVAESASIGPIPESTERARAIRKLCSWDLLLALQWYFPDSTGLSPMSVPHMQALDRMERALHKGGRDVNAVFRGFAKTTMSENAAIIAACEGWRRYLVILCANQTMADECVQSLKTEFAENDRLMEGYPEVCYPVMRLEGKYQKCASQTYTDADGEEQNTKIRWKASTLMLPHVSGSRSSGCMMTARGLTSDGIRGLKVKLDDGTQQRPDFVMADDPQTDDSAASPLQVRKRLDLLYKSVLMLGGHRSTMAAIVNGTIIRPGDMIDKLLSDDHPSFRGRKVPFMVKRASNEELWTEDYAKLRNTHDEDDPDDKERAHAEATAFYVEHREAMDAGAEPTWLNCYNPENEISAVQHFYNIVIDNGEDVAECELQLNPAEPDDLIGDMELPTEKALAENWGPCKRGVFHELVQHRTCFIDVQHRALFWMVCGFSSDFSGWVVDYNVFPRQTLKWFDYSQDILKHPERGLPGDSVEEAIAQGLTDLTDLLSKKYSIDQWVVDSGDETDTVVAWCGSSPLSPIPSQGMGLGPNYKPISEWSGKSKKRRVGMEWFVEQRQLRYDSNRWKTFTFQRLMSSNQSLRFPAGEHHELLAMHLKSEVPLLMAAPTKGRQVFQWSLKPSRPDNHWLDCLVGNCVAASMLGATLPQHKQPRQTRRKSRIIIG